MNATPRWRKSWEGMAQPSESHSSTKELAAWVGHALLDHLICPHQQ
jgi:hypothetical protein